MASVVIWDRQKYAIMEHLVIDMALTPLLVEEVEKLDKKEKYTFVLDTASASYLQKDGYTVFDLRNYVHPEETIYLFGENSSHIPMWEKIKNNGLKGEVVHLELPVKRLLHSETACAMVLYDRYLKQYMSHR